MIVCSASSKPLVLAHILHEHDISHSLCFTKTTEAASRLVKLLELLEDSLEKTWSSTKPFKKIKVASFSSQIPVAERTAVLKSFRSGQVDL